VQAHKAQTPPAFSNKRQRKQNMSPDTSHSPKLNSFTIKATGQT